MPDLFSQDFERYLSKKVGQVCREHRDSPKSAGLSLCGYPAVGDQPGSGLARARCHDSSLG